MTSSVSSLRPSVSARFSSRPTTSSVSTVELEHVLERVALLLEDRVELVDLGRGARVAVEQEALRGVRLGQAVAHQAVGQLVRHVLAGVDDRLDLEPERGLVAHVGAEDVAGGDGRDAEVLGDLLGLGALARAGRAEDEEAHQRRNPS